MLLILVMFLPYYSLGGLTEGDLYTQLLEEYEPLERPVENSSEPVIVHMGLVLQQIIDVDEKNQVVDVNAWLKLTWKDYSLHWDPQKYGGVRDLRFRKDQLWTPDVLMYNSADPQFDSTYASNIVVYPDGTINWIPPGLFRLSCRIEVVWFPFDVQHCFMKFGSWTFDGTKLDLRIDENGFDTSNYMKNGEWHLVSTDVSRNIQFYQCCPEPYYDIIFSFAIRRRVLYYGFNLILPCVLITLLTLIGFTLPPDAGEKMSLRAFFAVCMFTCACCVTATTMALNFHHRNSKSYEMSETFRAIMLNWLPWALCMHRPGFIASRGRMIKLEAAEGPQEEDVICWKSLLSSIAVDTPTSSPRMVRIVDETADSKQQMDQTTKQHLWRNERATAGFSNKVHPGFIAQLLVLQQIHTNVVAINKTICMREESKEIDDDWKFSAMVVDRLCLFIFTFFILFSTIALFSSVPNIASSL